MAEQTTFIKSAIKPLWQSSTFNSLFPIASIEKLQDLEDLIKEDNTNELVSIVLKIILINFLTFFKTPMQILAVKTTLGTQGIRKGIIHIFSKELILKVNLNGTQKMAALKSYPKVMDVLFGKYDFNLL